MHYHTTISAQPVEDFQLALAQSIALAREKNIKQIAIAVHGKGNLDGVVSDTIGEGAVKTLQKTDGTINYEELNIFVITEKKSKFKRGIIIATHASTKYLNKPLHDSRATDLIYVPWSPNELDEFLSEHNSEAVKIK